MRGREPTIATTYLEDLETLLGALLARSESDAGENLDAATALLERCLAEYRKRLLFWGSCVLSVSASKQLAHFKGFMR
jgi:hypothetical protein